MHRIIAGAALCAALTGGLAVAGAQVAQADTPSDGVVGLTAPVTVAGDALAVLGQAASSSGGTTASSSSSGLVGVTVPVTMDGDALSVLGGAAASGSPGGVATTTSHTATGGGTTTATTTVGSTTGGATTSRATTTTTHAAGKGVGTRRTLPATTTRTTHRAAATTAAPKRAVATGSDVSSGAAPCIAVTRSDASAPLTDTRGTVVETVEGGVIVLLAAALAFTAGRRFPRRRLS